MSELTPLMKQYQDIKMNHPDAIVFFRLGDFYEMFGQDAITASKILQITLTTRDKGKDNPVPMCGVPYFTAEGYIARLVKAGYKVAICEQMEDAKDSRGIVDREVVRVITPGTFIPDDPKENNYILSLFQKEMTFGIAAADITTGEFILYESSNSIADEISRFRPGEVIYPMSLKDNPSIISNLRDYYLTPYDDLYFDYIEAYRRLLTHFRVTSLDGFGCEGMIVAISSAGALLNYIEETQRGNIRFKRLRVLRTGSYMLIDGATQRNLEILRNIETGEREGSLLWAMDETLTPMGGRLLRRWLINPLLSVDDIKIRQSAVTFFFERADIISRIRKLLDGISDIERITSRISSGSANARDLLSLRDSLGLLPQLKSAITSTVTSSPAEDEFINSIADRIDTLTEVYRLIDNAIDDDAPATLKEGGLIKNGFNKGVDELREIRARGKDFIASLQERERKRTGISSLKVGYNRVFGYYIEVTKPNLSLVPNDYIRKQTLTSGERFITPELKEYEERVLSAEGRLSELEYQIFIDIRDNIALHTEGLQRTVNAIAEIDAYQSLAYVAKRHNYVCPYVDDSGRIEIVEGRHPVLELLPRHQKGMSLNERFIPNDTLIDKEDNRVLIITGPNMAGKSTYMRQVALIVLLAQIGSFVPAKDARIGIVDRIFTRIGASDIITRGQSTFMVEMLETANILNNATDRSLIILDEVGRGTSTFDGISIAWAVVEYIVKRLRSRTLFATHYHELTELALCLDGIRNLNVAVKEWDDEVIFLRRVVDGPADKSYGIQVAKLAGLPEETITRAKEVLENLERSELNELGTPRLAFSRQYIKTQGQLDLFTTQADPIIKEILGLDVVNMTPIEAMNKLYEIRKRLSEDNRNN
ncbi:MAG: DNA mismatch repair protein MutS [Thermodesulfovibrionia bacterium]